MSYLPSTPRSFMDLLGLSIRHHFSAFRKMIFLIVLMVIVKDAYIYLGGMPQNLYLLGLVGVVMSFLLIYFVSTLLYLSHRVLGGEAVDWRVALKAVLPALGKIILAFLIFTIFPYLLILMGEWVTHVLVSGAAHKAQYAGLILVLSIGIPILIFYITYFFAVPLMLIDKLSLGKAFANAAHLASREWRNWGRVFGVYACGIAIWVLVSPDTLHGHLMKMYKLSAAFDFVVFCVTLPIMMNFIVFMCHDLKLRRALRESGL